MERQEVPVTSACIPFPAEVASGESNCAEPLKNNGQIAFTLIM